MGYTGEAHGHAKGGVVTPEYRAWQAMKNRCYNVNVPAYRLYGARGITVCARWRTSFEAFLEDVGPKPEPKRQYSLERLDSNQGYVPGNVVWATAKAQARNLRITKHYTIVGEAKTLPEWAELHDVSVDLVRQRITKFGWSIERALTAPSSGGGRHGPRTGTPRQHLYRIWYAIRAKCADQRHARYKDYGAKGIRLCSEWLDFEQFHDDVLRLIGARPTPQHSLDRIDGAGGYTPTNVRWATATAQTRNRRNTRTVALCGRELPLAEWAELAAMEYQRVKQRVLTYRWPLAIALGTPVGNGRVPEGDRRRWYPPWCSELTCDHAQEI